MSAGTVVAARSQKRLADRRVGLDLLWQLSRPHTDADRRRFRLVAAAVAGCGMFLIAAVAILTAQDSLREVPVGGDAYTIIEIPGAEQLTPFVAEPGLRGGTALGAVLLAVPFVLFGVQALRTGTAARERRLAALSLAGATRPQLRRLASLEGTRAAVIGALLAGPGYLLLWVAFGLLLPAGAKMLPRPGVAVLLSWPVLVVLLGLAGAGAARFAARRGTVSPLGLVRGRPELPRKTTLTSIVVAVVGLVVGFEALGQVHDGILVFAAMAAAIVLLATSGGPWLVMLIARMAIRGDLVTMLAGRRLLADVRSPGRVAGVLFTVGIVFGVIAAMVVGVIADPNIDAAGRTFYLGGLGVAGVAALLAALVATGSLIVGVTEQVLHERRATAVLVALAASPDFVCRVVQRQLLLAAVPATLFGVVPGWMLMSGAAGELSLPEYCLGLLAVTVVSGLAAAAGALVTARAVRSTIRESSTPDNLRVA